MLSGRKRLLARHLKHWFSTARRYKKERRFTLDENLAVGWFPQEVPVSPLSEGHTFIVHATGAENGELWTRSAGRPLPVLHGLQNVPIYYLLITRKQGAAYYAAAAIPGTLGLPAYPDFRLLAIDPFGNEDTLYAGVFQSVLGQIGFRVDTRVYGAQVDTMAEFGDWYGSAHAADHLANEVPAHGRRAETGGAWHVSEEHAALYPERPSGFVSLMRSTDAGLVWRALDHRNYWAVKQQGDHCELQLCQGGKVEVVAAHDNLSATRRPFGTLQVMDDGKTFGVYLNGSLLFNRFFSDDRLSSSCGLGVLAHNGATDAFISIEAHPRTIRIGCLDLDCNYALPATKIALRDDFQGGPGDLDGTSCSDGAELWRKEFGTGAIELTQRGSAKVRASAEAPNPGRTIYLLPWHDPAYADVQVEITPPGTRRGQGEDGRGGLIFWQDQGNYIIVNNWVSDQYKGASISSFFTVNGFEDIYDAVWTNVGSRVAWGQPHTLRVAFDGRVYTAFVNEEPVLHRSLQDVYPDCQRMAIRKVGIVANWEWGNDTGSEFRHFIAKGQG